MGHIGTHLDCYTAQPAVSECQVDAVVADCRRGMPTASDVRGLGCAGKALVLYTSALETHGYGAKGYGEANTFLEKSALQELLIDPPQFILIDGCGIGNHGEEHKRFDRLCEAGNCFVVENIKLTEDVARTMEQVLLRVDMSTSSTGKPCEVYALCSENVDN